jgi:hypothetical protein
MMMKYQDAAMLDGSNEELANAEVFFAPRRYVEPKKCKVAKRRLRGAQVHVLDFFIEQFCTTRDGMEVKTTSRQIAKALEKDKHTVVDAITALIREKFIVRTSTGTARREPSKFRLTMFECGGVAPSHSYVCKASRTD